MHTAYQALGIRAALRGPDSKCARQSARRVKGSHELRPLDNFLEDDQPNQFDKVRRRAIATRIAAGHKSVQGVGALQMSNGFAAHRTGERTTSI
jgi:hypothetical protein